MGLQLLMANRLQTVCAPPEETRRVQGFTDDSSEPAHRGEGGLLQCDDSIFDYGWTGTSYEI